MKTIWHFFLAALFSLALPSASMADAPTAIRVKDGKELGSLVKPASFAKSNPWP